MCMHLETCLSLDFASPLSCQEQGWLHRQAHDDHGEVPLVPHRLPCTSQRFDLGSCLGMSRPCQVTFRSPLGHPVFRSLSGHLQVTRWSGHFQVTFRSLSGHFQVTFRSPPGQVTSVFRSLSGHFQVTFRSLSGHLWVTPVFRSPSGHFQVTRPSWHFLLWLLGCCWH
jgi:hypothetical protein